MSEFEKSYKLLNPNQKKAVDQIDGPVMVLAGPGTGKTQLLSARVANILKLTDVNPSNILCLTYTEAGVSAMRERLAKVLGPDGYQVSVHTFHSFSLEVMRRFPDYFLETNGFTAIEDLSKFQILENIHAKLPQSFKLRHKSFGMENRINVLADKISELKKNGLTPEQANQLAENNTKDLESIQEILELFPLNLNIAKAKKLQLVDDLAIFLSKQNLEPSEDTIKPLKNIILEELAQTILQVNQTGDPKLITGFKDAFLEKNGAAGWRFQDSALNQNLKELAHIYELYQKELNKLEKLEFDDMILNLISTITNNQDLKLNLQEKWQYILVDEFQDTSFSQLEIIKLLGDNPSNLDQPNIMVVGDDDQAIYAFQGASVSNFQSFTNHFPETKIISLEDNYRSSQNILKLSLETAKQIQERPAGTGLKELQKKSEHSQNLKAEIVKLTDLNKELSWVTNDIKKQIESGTKAEDIAILAPKHRMLQDLASELAACDVPVYYETSSNILEDEIILELQDLAKLIINISKGDLTGTNHLLANVLLSKYWQLPAGSIWKLASFAKNTETKKHWLEHLADGALGEPGLTIYTQLISWSDLVKTLSLEQSLDLIIGVSEPKTTDSIVPKSPFKNFYFSSNRLNEEPALYANFLASISTLRDHLRAYFTDLSNPKLEDFLNYLELCQQHGGIRIARRGLHIKPTGVNLITAYGSKGLEFDQVYLIHCQDDVWGSSARSKGNNPKLPANFTSHKDTEDDKTRLFYVAQSRAKSRLVHSLHKFNEKGKPKVELSYLAGLEEHSSVNYKDLSDDQFSAEEAAENYEQKLFKEDLNSPNNTVLAEVLQPELKKYRLSATHLDTWLDPEYGGKEEFITRHLLRFPQAMSQSAVHGSAMHKALEKAQLRSNTLSEENWNEDLISFLSKTYQQEVNKSSLDPESKESLIEQAKYTFNKFESDISNLFKNETLSEVDIKTNLEEIKLSGKLDAIIIDRETGTAIVRDYKTGRPKTKMEDRYKNQLYFYKLLLEHSGTLALEGRRQGEGKEIKLSGAELVYLHPSEESVVTLKLNYSETEYQQFKELIKQTWQEIMNLGQS